MTEEHWQAIDTHERTSGEPHGRPRVKLASVAELLRIAHGWNGFRRLRDVRLARLSEIPVVGVLRRVDHGYQLAH